MRPGLSCNARVKLPCKIDINGVTKKIQKMQKNPRKVKKVLIILARHCIIHTVGFYAMLFRAMAKYSVDGRVFTRPQLPALPE